MEEILASIRRIISDDPNAGRPAVEPDNAEDEQKPKASRPEDDVLDLAEVAKQSLVAEPSPREDDDVEFRDAPPEVSEPQVMAETARQAPPIEPTPSDVRAAPVESRIMSPGTDATVSNAFRSLANTILTNNARTLEDLVREMMRPMLKTWLDDNLPSLVERLVRAEIERVARGGR